MYDTTNTWNNNDWLIVGCLTTSRQILHAFSGWPIIKIIRIIKIQNMIMPLNKIKKYHEMDMKYSYFFYFYFTATAVIG